MEYQNPHNQSTDLSFIQQPVEQTQVKNFMANVFAYMFMALGVSALFAYLFAVIINLDGTQFSVFVKILPLAMLFCKFNKSACR